MKVICSSLDVCNKHSWLQTYFFVSQNCHCLLDIAPHAIERLHSVHIYPIVLFIRYKSTKQIKWVPRLHVGSTEVYNAQVISSYIWKYVFYKFISIHRRWIEMCPYLWQSQFALYSSFLKCNIRHQDGWSREQKHRKRFNRFYWIFKKRDMVIQFSNQHYVSHWYIVEPH